MQTRAHTLDEATPGTPALGGTASRADFWIRVLVFRAVMGVLLASAFALLPQFGPNRGWYAVAIASTSAMQNAALFRFVRRTGTLPSAVAWSDYLFGAVVGVIVPSVFPWVMIILTSTTALIVIGFQRRLIYRLVTVSAVPYLLIGLRFTPSGWIPAYAIFILCSYATVYIIGYITQEERSLRDRYSTLVEQLDMIVWESVGTSRDSVVYVNEQVQNLLGHSQQDWLAPGFWESLVHDEDRAVIEVSKSQFDAGSSHDIEYRIRNSDGEYLWVLELIRVILDNDGQATGARGVIIDIAERKGAEEQIRQFGKFMAEIPLALSILHLDDPGDLSSFRYLAANRRACQDAEATLEELMAWRPTSTRFESPKRGVLDAFAEVIRTGRDFETRDFERLGHDGLPHFFRIRATPLGHGSIGVCAEDVTEQIAASENLRFQAMHDSLTGLPNRALLHDRLTQALAASHRSGGQIALMFMDLNQFKEVNDALGHHHGDRLLIELGRRLGEVVRSCDTVARLGGDEFAVLLSVDVTTEGALATARRIARRFEEPVEIDGVTLQSNVSVGIAFAPEHGTDAEILTQRADVAMYKAKRSGAGVALYSPEQDHSSLRRLTILSDLKRAVADDQLVVHYQPRIDLATGDIIDVEALVRWQHPVHGLLPPAEFIELAEVSGVIQQLTTCVMNRSVSDIGRLVHDGYDIGVAVNLSVRNLYDPTLLDTMALALMRSGIASSRLRVELTESELMDDPALAMDVLSQMRSHGIEISVDDFGTGYSSLSYLRNLPISEIKIDKSFVSDLDHGDSTLVRSIIELGHNLGLRVVAEGVESGPVMRELADLHCDTAQGYFISRPLAFDDLVSFLDRDGDHYRSWTRATAVGPNPLGRADNGPGAKWEPRVTDR